MQIRKTADYRTVIWVAAAIVLVGLQYAFPDFVPYALPLSCYLAMACGVIAHNHNHRATFRGRWANHLFGHVLTVFYGYPTMMWIPTHNLNHHRFVNRPGDATITWRYTNRHNLFVALTYFFVSSYFQSAPINAYIRRAKLNNRSLYRRIVFQYAIWLTFFVAMLLLSIWLQLDRTQAFVVWFFALVVPAFTSVAGIMVFNFVQHVHTDAWSQHDHSRNFTSKSFNFLFFNNGYHTAHHQHPGRHWSELPGAHAQLEASIDPRLNERSLIWFALRQYVLAPLVPSFGTQQIGREPSAAAQEIAAAAALVREPHSAHRPLDTSSSHLVERREKKAQDSLPHEARSPESSSAK